uniref:Uncharacterized protein n=1 Tax=Rhizophora mucronata TaxID=61149 RepID=A0A2P2QKE8_RHIMU
MYHGVRTLFSNINSIKYNE